MVRDSRLGHEGKEREGNLARVYLRRILEGKSNRRVPDQDQRLSACSVFQRLAFLRRFKLTMDDCIAG